MREATAKKQEPEFVELSLEGGGSVVVAGREATILDAKGRVVVRYEEGRAEIFAPQGDLVLAAPSGKVKLCAGTDIELEAQGDLKQKAGGEASLSATRISRTASHLVEQAERIEVTATRLVERTRDAYREATALMETRAGRVRSLVDDVFALISRRTTLTSKEDTSIDGKRVLLG